MSWALWLWWVLASVAGAIVGAALAMVAGQALSWDRIWQAGLPQFIAESLNGGLYHAILGGVVGGAQLLVLRRHLRGMAWWLPATIVGTLLGGAASSPLVWPAIGFLSEQIGPIDPRAQFTIVIAVGLLTTGVAQWLVLQRRFREAGWWVLASALGGVIGGVFGAVSFLDASQFVDWTVAWAAGWAGGAAVTGVVLVWLVRYAQPISYEF
jgi:hypothetical protein